MADPPSWHAADQAYQSHHTSCSTCIAAGKNPDLPRCPQGQELWDAYNQAGEPPHFLWLQRKPRTPAKPAARPGGLSIPGRSRP